MEGGGGGGGKTIFSPAKGEAINRIWDDYLYSVESVWKSDFKKWRNFCENWEKLLTQIRRKWGKRMFQRKGFQTFTLDDKLKTELRFGTDLNRNPDFKLFHRGKSNICTWFSPFSLSTYYKNMTKIIISNHIPNNIAIKRRFSRNEVKKSY